VHSKLTLATLLALSAAAAAAPAWEPAFSNEPLSSSDAEAYCASRGGEWRLPVRSELEALGLDDAGKPRKGAPKLPRAGYLWSGEDVSEERAGQRWIMNLANGHVFNGDGREGYAKCVKGSRPVVVDLPLVPGYLFVGPADAKLTIQVAVQLDYIWTNKGRPLVEAMLAKHPVRFELHAFTISDRYTPVAVAACAVGQQKKFTAFEAKLAELKLDAPKTAAGLKQLAIDAGADRRAYDKAVVKCRKLVDADVRAYKQRRLEASPVFFVGATRVVGALPDELDVAITAALGG